MQTHGPSLTEPGDEYAFLAAITAAAWERMQAAWQQLQAAMAGQGDPVAAWDEYGRAYLTYFQAFREELEFLE
jgi:hypothetical protein